MIYDVNTQEECIQQGFKEMTVTCVQGPSLEFQPLLLLNSWCYKQERGTPPSLTVQVIAVPHYTRSVDTK